MNSQQLEELRELLKKEQKEVDEMLTHNDNFGMELASVHESLGELSSYDNHPADHGSELFEREKDLALSDHEEKHQHELEEALKRIDQGTYGQCAECGREIPFERLQALPTAVYCIEHQRDDKVSQRRPIEEEFLFPPFGRLSFDEKDTETEFDSEDSWQAVARYGTSVSPAYTEAGRSLNYNEVYIESDEAIGYVEDIEAFIITGIEGGAGENYDIERNAVYRAYIARNEGEGIMEE
jgi:YteA family regulatory protein